MGFPRKKPNPVAYTAYSHGQKDRLSRQLMFLFQAIGYAITIVAFSLQPCMMALVQRMSGGWRVLVVDIYHLFSFFGTVNVWRGVWNLLNHYFLPGNRSAAASMTTLRSKMP